MPLSEGLLALVILLLTLSTQLMGTSRHTASSGL